MVVASMKEHWLRSATRLLAFDSMSSRRVSSRSGYAARRQIEASNGRQGGDGLAIAGIVLGWVGVGTFLYFGLLVGSLTHVIP